MLGRGLLVEQVFALVGRVAAERLQEQTIGPGASRIGGVARIDGLEALWRRWRAVAGGNCYEDPVGDAEHICRRGFGCGVGRRERRPEEDKIDAFLCAGAPLQGDADGGGRYVERQSANGYRQGWRIEGDLIRPARPQDVSYRATR